MKMPLSFDNQQLIAFRDWVGDASRIVVVAHRNADGDAMGSALGMMHVLRALGKDVVVVLPNGCPHTFAWMPGGNEILSGEKAYDACCAAFVAADLIVATDFNQCYRVAMLEKPLRDARCRKVLIDHHEGPDRDAFDIVFSEPPMSSASELCYWVVSAVWGSDAVTHDAAECFYTGIRTDTGGMNFSCSHPSLYEAVADLVAKDIDPDRLNHLIFDNFSLQRLQFYAFAISNRLRVFPEHKLAYFYISIADQKRFGVSSAEMEGLVNYTLKMNDIEIGLLIREEYTRIKISFRAKFDYNVERIAREHFGGGGHIKAAGADCTGMKLEEVIDKIEDIFHLKDQ